jgi:hypothetical protein
LIVRGACLRYERIAWAAALHILDTNLPGSWLMACKAPDQASRKVLTPLHAACNGSMIARR